MEKVLVEIEIKDGKAVASLENVSDNVEGIGKAAKKTEKGVKSFGKTLSSLGKAAGIVGLLSAAFEILKEAFQNNQAVMDAVNTATTALGIVFNDLYHLIADNVQPVIDKITEAFNDLPGTFDKIKTAIK